MTIIPTAFAQEGIIKAVSDFIPGGVENIFNLGLGVGAILALGTIIYAGILYTTAGDSESKQKDAKEWILSAAKGLGLIAFGWILLNIVNPNITKIKEIEVEELEEISNPNIEYTSDDIGVPSSATGEGGGFSGGGGEGGGGSSGGAF
ncbi:MAG: pilin [Candidatus Colwellbacteria bacterium]|nr:pilin [Candidatus Colwellbacteria bacterium]